MIKNYSISIYLKVYSIPNTSRWVQVVLDYIEGGGGALLVPWIRCLGKKSKIMHLVVCRETME